jgi:hypothetical protein
VSGSGKIDGTLSASSIPILDIRDKFLNRFFCLTYVLAAFRRYRSKVEIRSRDGCSKCCTDSLPSCIPNWVLTIFAQVYSLFEENPLHLSQLWGHTPHLTVAGLRSSARSGCRFCCLLLHQDNGQPQ